MNKKSIQIRHVLWNVLICLFLVYSFSSCKEKKQQTTDEISESLPSENDGYIKIFDGVTLDDWKGDPVYWSVENGNLMGKVTPETLLENNTFIIWQGGEPDDFELKLECRITEDGNSGINYRSESIDTIPFALRGYQADIDGKNKYTGQNYEEKKRTTLAYRGEQVNITSQDNPDEEGSLRANVAKNCWQSREVVKSLGHQDSLATQIKKDDWNKIHLVVRGNRLKHYVNDMLMSDVTDNDTINRIMSGKLGVQVHVGPPMKVEFRNIRLKVD